MPDKMQECNVKKQFSYFTPMLIKLTDNVFLDSNEVAA